MYADADSIGLAAAKSAVREAVRGRRDAVDAGARAALSRAIIQDIIALDAYRRSRVVMAYVTFGSELQTGAFIRHALGAGKTLILPRVNRAKRALELYEVREPARDLEQGVWGSSSPSRIAARAWSRISSSSSWSPASLSTRKAGAWGMGVASTIGYWGTWPRRGRRGRSSRRWSPGLSRRR